MNQCKKCKRRSKQYEIRLLFMEYITRIKFMKLILRNINCKHYTYQTLNTNKLLIFVYLINLK